MSRRNSVNDLDADFVYAFNGGEMTDIVERLRGDPDGNEAQHLLEEAADEIERLEHMKANLHSHIKRLEEENARWILKEGNARAEAAFLHAENSRLKFKAQGDCQEIRQLYAENAKLRNAAPDENNLF